MGRSRFPLHYSTGINYNIFMNKHPITFFLKPKIASSSEWLERNLAFNREILQAFFSKRMIESYNETSVNEFKGFLKSRFPQDPTWPQRVEQIFNDALQDKDFERFYSALKHINVSVMNEAEKLVALQPKAELTISDSEASQLRQYMEDQKISGSVCLGHSNETFYILTSEESKSSPIFAIHSVAKVFTGMLVLLMLNHKDKILTVDQLDKPVELDPKDMELLPKPVQKFLVDNKVTLHELMTHKGGLGDYMTQYLADIEAALKQGKTLNIQKPEDFLKFADPETHKKEKKIYSNLGILLVGLAVKQAYAKKYGINRPYNEILEDYIIRPAGMQNFFVSNPKLDKPEMNVKPGENDPTTPYIAGSPAGGYWTTTEDLARFGQWIYNQCQDKDFKTLLERFGEEFYQMENNTVAHSGDIKSASSYLSISLENGAVAACLSDQPQQARELNWTIQLNIVCADSKLTPRKSLSPGITGDQS